MDMTPKILIVEDNAIVAADMKERIQKMGYRVIGCLARGERAIDSLKTELPDLILMDIKLKGELSGIETAAAIRAEHDIPVIYITSYSDEKTLELAKATDPFGYIVKPFEDRELRIVIELAIHKHTMGRRLKENEQWFKTTLSSIGDGVITTDMQGCVTFMNPVAETLTGWNIAEAKGLPITDVFHIVNEESREIVKNPVTKVIETGRTVGLANHTLLISKNGRELPIKDSSAPILLDNEQPVGIVLVFQDNEKDREAEKKLQASEEKFRVLFDYAPLPYQSLNKDGYILHVNQTWLRTLGYEKEEVEGQFFGDFLKPEWRGHFEENFPKFKSIGEVLGVQFEMVRKDGTYLTVQFDGKISSDAHGDFLRTHCVFRDITQEVKLSKQLQEQEKELRQHQKLEAIGTLAGGIAHNFNNILSAIIGFTELSIEDVTAGTELHDNLEEVYSASIRAKTLVDQILAFSREEDDKKQIIEVQSLVHDALGILRETVPASIEITETTNNECIKIKANITQLQQVFMNIVTNSVYAMGSEGTVSVKVDKVHIDESRSISGVTLPSGEYAKIVFRDTGSGIANEHIDRIFDPYFTTKPQGKGSGLGLSVAHGIVSSHGGQIIATSEVGLGTDFTVYLPFYSETVEAQTAQLLDRNYSGSERVLVVDDEIKLTKIYERHLVRSGYDVTIALGSTDALERFREKPDDFDLVITDMAMPWMTGLQLAKEIKVIRPGIPVLLCTGYSEEIDQKEPLPVQLNGLIMKPVERGQLLKKIREILDDV